jgi:hypothetical protein
MRARARCGGTHSNSWEATLQVFRAQVLNPRVLPVEVEVDGRDQQRPTNRLPQKGSRYEVACARAARREDPQRSTNFPPPGECVFLSPYAWASSEHASPKCVVFFPACTTIAGIPRNSIVKKHPAPSPHLTPGHLTPSLLPMWCRRNSIQCRGCGCCLIRFSVGLYEHDSLLA